MACAWELTAGEEGVHRVLPDGCIDVVWRDREGLQVAGPSTAAFTARVTPGDVVCGVRLRMGAAPALLGVPAPALLDAHVPAALVWGDDARRLEEALAAWSRGEGRGGDGGGGGRARPMLDWLAGRVRPVGPPDPLAVAVADALRGDPGLAVPVLARRVAIGERQLRRRVTAAVGFGPKRLGRVLRLQRVLALRAERPLPGWADVAHRAGYADQAHLAEDVRALTGVSPTSLRTG